MSTTTRTPESIYSQLTQWWLTLSERLALGVEHYIASTVDSDRHPQARQELPFIVQFLPIVAQYGGKMPVIRDVNPGIPHGWLTEYPKSLIYDSIPDDFRIRTVDFLVEDLPAVDDVLASISDNNIQRPVMLKADKGERGAGIYYINDEDALREHRCSVESGNILRFPSSIQEFVTMKQEYCLQFYHYVDDNGEEQREYGWLTLRDIPHVTGDGKHTVRELISQLGIDTQHKHNITTKMTLNESSALDRVPVSGEAVTVVRTASLDYGTKYVPQDLTHDQEQQAIALSKALLENIDTDVLCVWRFDLKAESLEWLLDGACKVIELNAGGWIPTHVYDETLSIEEKYVILREHFDHMVRIAWYNKTDGWPLRHVSGYTWVLSASLRSLKKKWITSSSSQSKHIKSIIRHITTLLRKARYARTKQRFLWFFGR